MAAGHVGCIHCIPAKTCRAGLGAGRVVYQEFTRVSRAIKTGSFFTNRTLTDAVDQAIENLRLLNGLWLRARAAWLDRDETPAGGGDVTDYRLILNYERSFH